MLSPLVKVRNLVPITQVANGWVMSSGLAVTDIKTGDVIQMPLDEANNYFADPSGIAADPAGRRAFVASGGGDVVTVVDLDRLAGWLEKADPATKREAIYDMSLSPEYVTARIPTERNPKQLALSPDGGTLFVAERLADSILVVDAKSLAVQGRIVLGDGGLNDPIRRGERVFTKAGFTFQNQFSCRSCHPDGHVDGLSYDFDTSGIGDNLLDNRSLMGVAGTEPFKWNGKNPSLEVQCGPRFAKVLMRTDPIPQKELLDLTTYIKSLPPHRVAPERGRHADAVAGARQGDFLRHQDPGRQGDSARAPVFDLPSPAAVLGAAVVRRGHRRDVRHPAFAGRRRQRAVSARRPGAIAGGTLDHLQPERPARREQLHEQNPAQRFG